MSTQAMQSLNSIHLSRHTRPLLSPRTRGVLSLALALVLLTTLTCYTNRYQMQGVAVASPLQLNLGALIDALQARYGRMQGLAADFSQVYSGADGRRANESGHL